MMLSTKQLSLGRIEAQACNYNIIIEYAAGLERMPRYIEIRQRYMKILKIMSTAATSVVRGRSYRHNTSSQGSILALIHEIDQFNDLVIHT